MILGSSPTFTTFYVTSLNLISAVCSLYRRMTVYVTLGFGKYYMKEYVCHEWYH